jgi:AcrR family transcriptional regulator
MRERLTDAARAQLREGGPMTVPAVAARARVSRATAYRHFLNNDAVLLWATRPIDGDPLLPPPAIDAVATDAADLADRAEALIRSTARWAFEHERELRAVLAVSLTATRAPGDAPLRRGRMQRGRWIDDLLAGLPDTVTPATRARLAAALVPLFGADAVVWTRDAADLAPNEAIETLVWMSRRLITTVLTDADHQHRSDP